MNARRAKAQRRAERASRSAGPRSVRPPSIRTLTLEGGPVPGLPDLNDVLGRIPDVVDELWPEARGAYCFYASAVGQVVLSRYGLRAVTRDVSVVLRSDAALDADAAEVARMGSEGNHLHCSSDRDIPSHRVLVVDGSIIDLAAAQFTNPGMGITVPKFVIARYVDTMLHGDRVLGGDFVPGGGLFYLDEPGRDDVLIDGVRVKTAVERVMGCGASVLVARPAVTA
jgi:hypothetical protein